MTLVLWVCVILVTSLLLWYHRKETWLPGLGSGFSRAAGSTFKLTVDATRSMDIRFSGNLGRDVNQILTGLKSFGNISQAQANKAVDDVLEQLASKLREVLPNVNVANLKNLVSNNANYAAYFRSLQPKSVSDLLSRSALATRNLENLDDVFVADIKAADPNIAKNGFGPTEMANLQRSYGDTPIGRQKLTEFYRKLGLSDEGYPKGGLKDWVRRHQKALKALGATTVGALALGITIWSLVEEIDDAIGNGNESGGGGDDGEDNGWSTQKTLMTLGVGGATSSLCCLFIAGAVVIASGGGTGKNVML